MPDPSRLLRKPRPPSPQNHKIFDAWNSSSTGHQRADDRDSSKSCTWRDIRTDKLERQFRDGHCDDSSGLSMAFDGTCGSSPETKKGEWKWVSDAEAKREKLGVKDIRSFMGIGKRKAAEFGNGKAEEKEEKEKEKKVKVDSEAFTCAATSTASSTSFPNTGTAERTNLPKKPTLFAGTTVYINGSTLPRSQTTSSNTSLSLTGQRFPSLWRASPFRTLSSVNRVRRRPALEVVFRRGNCNRRLRGVGGKVLGLSVLIGMIILSRKQSVGSWPIAN